ncbi:MAG TPA: hypothetical protein VKA51_01595 [Rubrobacteraceae bacterium]|nr:hypothetical protein [Rubrobacteraceae bacterium]
MSAKIKLLGLAFLATAAMAAFASAPASAAFSIESFDMTFEQEGGALATQAGSHPFAVTSTIDFSVTKDPEGKFIADGSPKDLSFSLPPGFVGDRGAVPYCKEVDFLFLDAENEASKCPDESAVGVLRVRAPGEAGLGGDTGPAFNLAPPPGYAAKIGVILLHVPVAILVKVSPVYPHNLIATVKNTSDVEPLGGTTLTIWGDPSDEAHDEERGQCSVYPGTCPVADAERAFLTLPRSCEGPVQTTYVANSWEEPGRLLTGASNTPLITDGCEKSKFTAAISAQPTTTNAEGASGLAFGLDIEDPGLTDPSPAAIANSDIKKAVVQMPEGMTLNPSAAVGLDSCSPAQLEAETLSSEPGDGCPQASKVGTVEVETRVLEGEVVKGEVFVAAQKDNPFNSTFAIYMIIRDRKLGLLVKLAGKLEADPQTGQLTTTFGEPGQEVPQFPVSHLRFRFHEGPRGPLVTPPTCGDHTATATFTPWANPGSPLTVPATFTVGSGLNGGPCPSGTPPFAPSLTAGSTNNAAGAYSPFFLRLTRKDGERDITRLDAVLPKGVVGKIAGLARCGDAEVNAAKAKSGKAELASPSCPSGSRIGSTLGGAGVGEVLTYVPGSVYLGGPFAGSPLSIIAITPAVSGPFDLGTVVVRQGLSLDQSTGEVLIDGSAGGQIPRILEGIPLRLRDLRVNVDRPDFTLNPTSCEPLATKATIFGVGSPFQTSAPYRATNCAALKFKPKLTLKLLGGTKRGDHPALKSTLTYPKGPGYANVGRAVVKLPPSEFIDNARIKTPCTRVQFNANACPKGSILGTAKAITPLLDEPLEGPVYFRSNGGERLLPDVVADLKGLFHIVLVGKVDSVKGRIRTTFDQVPDAPVSKFTLNLKGGKQGLLVNNRSLCAKALKADVTLGAQNGLVQKSRPVVGTSCKKQGKPKKKGKGGKRGR